MKIASNQITKLLDRPIAFHRCFVDISGSVDGAVFLSQAIYWTKRTDLEQWFYKTAVEWEEETGIKSDRQKTIRNHLVKLGVLEEKKEGIPCKLFYRINLEKLSQLLNELTQNNVTQSPETSIGSEPKQAEAGSPSWHGLPADSILNNRDYTETTTDIIPPNPQGGENVNVTIPIVNSKPVRQRNLSDEMRETAFQNWVTLIKEHGLRLTHYEMLAVKSYAYSKPSLPMHEIVSVLYSLDKWVCLGMDIEDCLRQSLSTRTLIKPGKRVAFDSKNNRIYDVTTLNVIRQNELEREELAAKEANKQQNKV